MKIIETNCETGEVIEREMTKSELANYKTIVEKTAAEQAEIDAKEAARQAIADRLGLTADELKLLLG
jgi:hypothetical protein